MFTWKNPPKLATKKNTSLTVVLPVVELTASNINTIIRYSTSLSEVMLQLCSLYVGSDNLEQTTATKKNLTWHFELNILVITDR